MFKVVLDTNVTLAAYLTKGAAARIIEAWAAGKFELLISEEIAREYLRIFLSQNINPVLAAQFSNDLNLYATLIKPKTSLYLVKADPADDKFFECALEGGAKYIVSNDKHLLKVGEFKSISVLSVQSFLRLIETK